MSRFIHACKRWAKDHYEVTFGLAVFAVLSVALFVTCLSLGVYGEANFQSVLVGMHGSLFQFFLLTLVVGYMVLRQRRKGLAALRDHLSAQMLQYADDMMSAILSSEAGETRIVRFGEQTAHMSLDISKADIVWTVVDKRSRWDFEGLTQEAEYAHERDELRHRLQELLMEGAAIQALAVPLTNTVVSGDLACAFLRLQSGLKMLVQRLDQRAFEQRDSLDVELRMFAEFAESARELASLLFKKADESLTLDEWQDRIQDMLLHGSIQPRGKRRRVKVPTAPADEQNQLPAREGEEEGAAMGK